MRKTTLSLAAAIALAAAPTALAADHTGTLTPASPAFAWNGGPGTSIGTNVPQIGGVSVGNFVGCADGVADCEEILLKVDAPGKLTLLADSEDDSKDVLDMYLYATDESGEFSEGTPLLGFPEEGDEELGEGGGAGTTGDEKIEVQVQPGYYVVQIKFFLADGDAYKGTATLSGFPKPPVAEVPLVEAPAPVAPAAEQTAAPQSQPAVQAAPAPAAKKPSKKAACQKKAKKIKNKAKRKKALKKCAKLR